MRDKDNVANIDQGIIVAPLNITAAALITQFGLVIIATAGVAILRANEPPPAVYRSPRTSANLYTINFLIFVLTSGLLVFSDEFAATWRPLFSDAAFYGLSWSFALVATFIVNVIWVTILVSMTGGSTTSPFSPIYFILPALAIFLREPLQRIITCFILVTVGFSINLVPFNSTDRSAEAEEKPRATIIAYWFVSITCLVLSTFIGYITRPK